MKHATTTLAEIRGGLLNEELSEAIVDCTAAVRETGRKGKVTLEIVIEPFDGEAGEIERVTVRDKVTLKKPEKKKRDSVFFIDSNNNLQRQQTIPGVDQSAPSTGASKAG
jgi:hypothetical protein